MKKKTSKLTNCKACHKEIARSVKKCPSCGHDQRNWFMRHKILTIVFTIIAIIGNNGNSTTITTVSDKNSSVATSAKVVKIGVDKTIYGINETVKSNHASVTVTKVKKLNGGDYDKAKLGMEFVVVTVLIKNTGTGEIIYSPFNFKMQNSKGQITDAANT